MMFKVILTYIANSGAAWDVRPSLKINKQTSKYWGNLPLRNLELGKRFKSQIINIYHDSSFELMLYSQKLAYWSLYSKQTL